MHQSYTQLFHTTNCLDPKDICAFLQGQPSRTGNQPVQDIAVYAVSGQGDGLVSGFRGNRNDIAGQNIAFDLQILAIFVVDGRSHCHHFLRNVAGQCLNFQRETGFIPVIDNGKGMTEEELNSLRKKMAGTDTGDEAKGFGVSNVNQRIKYYYGGEYGVFFESKENEGTNATIIIAAKNIQLLS